MFNLLKKMYDEGLIDELYLNKAVAKKWITKKQKLKIIPTKDIK